MKQTVEQLFSAESGKAYIPLMWAGRQESPEEVAARVWSTMALIKAHLPPADSRFEQASWQVAAEDGLSFIPAPNTLSGVEELALRNTEMRNGVPSSPTALQIFLAAEGPESDSLAFFHALAGSALAAVANTVSFTFKQDYPLGTAIEAADLFCGLVRIWQPDVGILGTVQTINEIEDLYDSYAGYLAWVSHSALGAPPQLTSAGAERFGDGTLLTANTWTVEGLRDMHRELLAAGAPAVTAFPRTRQDIPRFPAEASSS